MIDWYLKIDNWIFGPRCCRCNCRGAHNRRMKTRYNHEPSNWTLQCERCFEQTEEEWADMWREYYGGLL